MAVVPERLDPCSSTLARRSWRAFLVVLVAAGALTACSARQHGASPTPAPAPVQTGPRGADVYERSCARCHGDAQEGINDAPALDGVRMSSLGDQRLRITIASGKGRMPAFGGLTPAQVDDLVAYLTQY